MKTKEQIINEDYQRESEWAEMTENNFHSEVRYEIAKHFGYDEGEEYFRSLIDKSSLSLDEVATRTEQTKLLLLAISLYYSHNVAVYINGLL